MTVEAQPSPRLLSPFEVLAAYPAHDYTLRGLFESRLQSLSTRTLLSVGEKAWSWQSFGSAVDACARMLVAKGVAKGDRLAILAANSDAHVLLLFAAARIGAILVPINPEFGVNEARYVLGHAGVSAIACSADTLDTARRACDDLDYKPWFMVTDRNTDGVATIDELMTVEVRAELPDDISADDTLAIIYSSGTTGFPKGVMHSQRNFVLSGEVHVGRTFLQPDDKALCILPMFHVNALFYSVASVFVAGARLIIAPRFSASEFWPLVQRSGATQVGGMMTITSILAKRPRSEFVSGHKIRVFCGSVANQATMDLFNNEFGVPKVMGGYGMTEIPAALGNPYEGPHKPGSLGKISTHPDTSRYWMHVRVIDDDERDVAAGEVGELVVRVPNIMQGYYRDPEQTAAAFREGWFLTGDLVRRDSDGYFYFVARKKDIIRRRGENIAGAELDRIIGEHPSVAEAAAIAVDAELGEDEIMAVVLPKPGAVLDAQEIKNWCAARLAPHKVPRFIVFANELPYTPTHKVAKHILKSDKTLRAKAIDLQAQVRA